MSVRDTERQQRRPGRAERERIRRAAAEDHPFATVDDIGVRDRIGRDPEPFIRDERVVERRQEDQLREEIAEDNPFVMAEDVRVRRTNGQLIGDIREDRIEEIRAEERAQIEAELREEVLAETPFATRDDVVFEEEDGQIRARVSPDAVEAERERQITELREQVAAEHDFVTPADVATEERDDEITARIPDDVIAAERERQITEIRETVAAEHDVLGPDDIDVIERDGELIPQIADHIVAERRDVLADELREEIAAETPFEAADVRIEDGGVFRPHIDPAAIERHRDEQIATIRRDVADQHELITEDDVRIREEDGRIVGEIPDPLLADIEAFEEERAEERLEAARAELRDDLLKQFDMADEDDITIVEEDGQLIGRVDPDVAWRHERRARRDLTREVLQEHGWLSIHDVVIEERDGQLVGFPDPDAVERHREETEQQLIDDALDAMPFLDERDITIRETEVDGEDMLIADFPEARVRDHVRQEAADAATEAFGVTFGPEHAEVREVDGTFTAEISDDTIREVLADEFDISPIIGDEHAEPVDDHVDRLPDDLLITRDAFFPGDEPEPIPDFDALEREGPPATIETQLAGELAGRHDAVSRDDVTVTFEDGQFVARVDPDARDDIADQLISQALADADVERVTLGVSDVREPDPTAPIAPIAEAFSPVDISPTRVAVEDVIAQRPSPRMEDPAITAADFELMDIATELRADVAAGIPGVDVEDVEVFVDDTGQIIAEPPDIERELADPVPMVAGFAPVVAHQTIDDELVTIAGQLTEEFGVTIDAHDIDIVGTREVTTPEQAQRLFAGATDPEDFERAVVPDIRLSEDAIQRITLAEHEDEITAAVEDQLTTTEFVSRPGPPRRPFEVGDIDFAVEDGQIMAFAEGPAGTDREFFIDVDPITGDIRAETFPGEIRRRIGLDLFADAAAFHPLITDEMAQERADILREAVGEARELDLHFPMVGLGPDGIPMRAPGEPIAEEGLAADIREGLEIGGDPIVHAETAARIGDVGVDIATDPLHGTLRATEQAVALPGELARATVERPGLVAGAGFAGAGVGIATSPVRVGRARVPMREGVPDTFTAVRLQTPLAVEAVGVTPRATRPIIGAHGARPTIGTPRIDPRDIDFARARGRGIDEFDPVTQFETELVGAARLQPEQAHRFEQTVDMARLGREIDSDLRLTRTEDVLREVRDIPTEAVEPLARVLREHDATIKGSASQRAQLDPGVARPARDLDVLVDDPVAFRRAVEREGIDPGAIDIAARRTEPGPGDVVQLGQRVPDRLRLDDGVEITSLGEELMRKAGATGMVRGTGRPGVHDIEVAPAGGVAGPPLRVKDPADAFRIGMAATEPGTAARARVEAFGQAFAPEIQRARFGLDTPTEVVEPGVTMRLLDRAPGELDVPVARAQRAVEPTIDRGIAILPDGGIVMRPTLRRRSPSPRTSPGVRRVRDPSPTPLLSPDVAAPGVSPTLGLPRPTVSPSPTVATPIDAPAPVSPTADVSTPTLTGITPGVSPPSPGVPRAPSPRAPGVVSPTMPTPTAPSPGASPLAVDAPSPRVPSPGVDTPSPTVPLTPSPTPSPSPTGLTISVSSPTPTGTPTDTPVLTPVDRPSPRPDTRRRRRDDPTDDLGLFREEFEVDIDDPLAAVLGRDQSLLEVS